jgi:hypothetical protein
MPTPYTLINHPGHSLEVIQTNLLSPKKIKCVPPTKTVGSRVQTKFLKTPAKTLKNYAHGATIKTGERNI